MFCLFLPTSLQSRSGRSGRSGLNTPIPRLRYPFQQILAALDFPKLAELYLVRAVLAWTSAHALSTLAAAVEVRFNGAAAFAFLAVRARLQQRIVDDIGDAKGTQYR